MILRRRGRVILYGMTTSPEPLDLNRRYTEAEYLAITETCEGRYDFVDGRMIDVRAMAGGTEFHSLICANVIGELHAALKGGPCRAYTSDLRVKNRRKSRYRYPDVSVACGPSEFADDDPKRFNLLNPTLLIEVVSETSVQNDYVTKLKEYLELESLREYVLVLQAEPRIDLVRRQPDGTWQIASVAGLDAVAELPSIGVRLKLVDVYAGVTFSPTEEEPAAV